MDSPIQTIPLLSVVPNPMKSNVPSFLIVTGRTMSVPVALCIAVWDRVRAVALLRSRSVLRAQHEQRKAHLKEVDERRQIKAAAVLEERRSKLTRAVLEAYEKNDSRRPVK